MTPLPTPSPLWVPSGVSRTALTLTCTTLGPTFEATLATGSSAGTGEDGSEEACGEALAVLFSWDTGCFSEHPASRIVPSNAMSKAERALDLDFNVPEPPISARSASSATESIRGVSKTVVHRNL